MKALLIIPAVLIGLLACSCRTACPLDPATMYPDCSRCRIGAVPSSCHHRVHSQTTEETYESSK